MAVSPVPLRSLWTPFLSGQARSSRWRFGVKHADHQQSIDRPRLAGNSKYRPFPRLSPMEPVGMDLDAGMPYRSRTGEKFNA
jgi:hypothetical protein